MRIKIKNNSSRDFSLEEFLFWPSDAITESSSGNIEIGEYTGNGKYGKSNQNTITFKFDPKFVIIRPDYINENSSILGNIFVWISGMTIVTVGLSDSMYYHTTDNYDIVSVSGKTISWYCPSTNGGTSAAEDQFNTSKMNYIYFAAG